MCAEWTDIELWPTVINPNLLWSHRKGLMVSAGGQHTVILATDKTIEDNWFSPYCHLRGRLIS